MRGINTFRIGNICLNLLSAGDVDFSTRTVVMFTLSISDIEVEDWSTVSINCVSEVSVDFSGLSWDAVSSVESSVHFPSSVLVSFSPGSASKRVSSSMSSVHS